jgi:hypothetical protein
MSVTVMTGGGVQRLFEASLATMSIITASHLKKPNKLVETIAGSTYANMIMVTGDDDGMVNILHHRFVNATSFGGEAYILFLSGNSSEAPVKDYPTPVQLSRSGPVPGGSEPEGLPSTLPPSPICVGLNPKPTSRTSAPTGAQSCAINPTT